MTRRSLFLKLLTVALVPAGSGCSSDSDLPLEAPPSALRLLSATPSNGSVLPGSALVHARLHYRLNTDNPGHITVATLCVKEGRPACFDYGSVADLPDREGDIDVAFSVRPPSEANIHVTLRLTAEGFHAPRDAVVLTYHTAN